MMYAVKKSFCIYLQTSKLLMSHAMCMLLCACIHKYPTHPPIPKKLNKYDIRKESSKKQTKTLQTKRVSKGLTARK